MKELMCNWAVCYDIPGTEYDDGKPHAGIVAVFRYPYDADSFIESLPNKSRFYVKRLSKLSFSE